MERAATPTLWLITLSYFESQSRVKNTDVTLFTICCHVDYYLIESCHNVHHSISGLLKFDVNKFLMFCKFSMVFEYGWLQG